MLMQDQRHASSRALLHHVPRCRRCIWRHIRTCGLTVLKGCREAKASLLRKGLLGYAVPEQEELLVRGRLGGRQ